MFFVENNMSEGEVTFTLREILNKCYDWDEFCEEFGWSVWAVDEGDEEITQTMTIKEARYHGLLRESPEW